MRPSQPWKVRIASSRPPFLGARFHGSHVVMFRLTWHLAVDTISKTERHKVARVLSVQEDEPYNCSRIKVRVGYIVPIYEKMPPYRSTGSELRCSLHVDLAAAKKNGVSLSRLATRIHSTHEHAGEFVLIAATARLLLTPGRLFYISFFLLGPSTY